MKFKTIRTMAAMTLVAGVLAFIIGRSFAATGQLYLSPASKSVQQGSSFSVDLRINPGVSVDGVEATITFDAAKLQLTSLDTASSAFTVQLSQNTGSGTASLARGNLSGGVSSDALVAKLTFKALSSSGSASISVSGNATAAGSYTNPGVVGSTISFTTPPTSPPPTGGGSSSGSSGGSSSGSGSSSSGSSSSGSSGSSGTSGSTGSNSGTSNQTVPKPVVTAQPEPQFTRSTIKVDCEAVKSYIVKYGLDKENLNLQTEVKSECGKELPLTALVGGTTYYYQVVATNAQGTQTTSEVKSFKTKGYTVRVTVLGQDGKPLRKQKVTLHSDPIDGVTDNDGVVEFADVPAGTHRLVYKSGKNELSQTLQVAETAVATAGGAQTATTQNFSVAYKASAKSPLPLVVGTVGVLVIAVVGGVVLLRRRNAGFAHLAPSGNTSTVVVGGTGFGPIPNVPTTLPTQPVAPGPVAQPNQQPAQPTVIVPSQPNGDAPNDQYRGGGSA